MHIADLCVASRLPVDEFIRVCTAASHADTIEITALTDLLRLIHLTLIKRQSSKDEITNFELLVAANRRILQDYIVELEAMDRLKGEERKARFQAFYARIGAALYAQTLLTYDQAIMPTDAVYRVDDTVVTVPRRSKLASRALPELLLRVSGAEEEHMTRSFANFIPDPESHQKVDYGRMIKNLKTLLEANEKLLSMGKFDLVPGAAALYEAQRNWYATITSAASKVFWAILTDPSFSPFTAPESQNPQGIMFDNLNTQLHATLSIPEILMKSTPVELRQEPSVIETYHDAMIAIAGEENAIKRRELAKVLFDKLLAGEYAVEHYDERLAIPNPLPENPINPRICFLNVKRDATSNESIPVACIFYHVSSWLHHWIPTILAPEYPLFQALRGYNYTEQSNAAIQGKRPLINDAHRNLMVQLYMDYVLNEMIHDSADEERARMQAVLASQVDDIYGEPGEGGGYNPRASRVAYQCTSFYFHFVEKYRWHTVGNANDWVGHVLFDSRAWDPQSGFMGVHDRPYSTARNSSIALMPHVGTEGQKTTNPRSHRQIRFNANLKREFILTTAAKQLFENDKSAQVWLGAIPDEVDVDVSALYKSALNTAEIQIQQQSRYVPQFLRRMMGTVIEKPTAVPIELSMLVKNVLQKQQRKTLKRYVKVARIAEMNHFGAENEPSLSH
jgi:hypothetical protein